MLIHRIEDQLTDSNCYIVTENQQALIIDPNDFSAIRQALSDNHWVPAKILLTHEHCDHISALNELRQFYCLPVLASEACSQAITSSAANMSGMMEVYLYYKYKEQKMFSYPAFTCAYADETFAEAYSFCFEHHIIRLRYLPGHSIGSTIIWMDDTCLFSGDYLIPSQTVITRLPGGSTRQYETTAKPYLDALSPGISIFPGHGIPYILKD